MVTARATDWIEPGYYETRLVKGGPPVGVMITFGPPVDPVTGEEMDRSWRHRVFVNDVERPDDGERRWQDFLWNVALCADRIDEHRYRYLAATAAWEAEHRPDLPAASPRVAVDLSRLKSLF